MKCALLQNRLVADGCYNKKIKLALVAALRVFGPRHLLAADKDQPWAGNIV